MFDPVLKFARTFLSTFWLATMIGVDVVQAESFITGGPGDVVIEAQDAAISDVLAALSKTFGVRYRGAALPERHITGRYGGPLPRVLARLLEGYDFVIKTESDYIEIIVLGVGRVDRANVGAPPRHRAD